jgi:TonB family protein
MRIILFALLAGVGYSQTLEDAAPLLQEVADVAKNTTNWHIEGSISYPGSGAGHDSSEQFRILIRTPSETRFEQTGKTSAAIIVCNGATAWIYSPPLHRYRKESSADSQLCSPIVGGWKVLPTSLQAPVVAGACGPNPAIQSPDYKLVRGFSEPELSSAGGITRTLCIDSKHKLIVWEKWESRYGARIYVYSKLDLNPQFTSEAFAWEPPAGSTRTDFEFPTPRPLGTPAMSRGLGVSPPRVVSKKEPKYGRESRKARIEGTVVLYVVIGIDGVPSEVLVYRSLSPDLDAEAMSSVRQWRFTPAMRNGQPTALPVMIEVNFRLLRR